MALLGKSIDLYLMDGSAAGRWQATLSNWNCNSYKIPRTDLKHCEDLPELHAPGVYFLFGRDDESGQQFVYVGEGDDALKRVLQPHTFEKDGSYWTEVVFLITPDGSLDKAKIKYLENRFHKIVIDTGRYLIKNGNTPPQSPVQKKVRDMLEEFIMNTQLIMPALGHKVFEPHPSAETEEQDDLLYFTRSQGKGGKAVGKIAEDGFWVLKGSYICPDIADYLPTGLVAARKKYADAIDSHGILQRDISFGSPSYASSFVCGKNSNGLTEWKNKDGVTLKELNEDNADKKKQTKKSHKTVTTDQLISNDTVVTENVTLLHLSSSKVSAKGYYTGGRFVVLAGSQMSPTPRKACRKSLLDRRNMLIENRQVENYVFMENITFGSPSTAAAVILGGETNGWTTWKNDAGDTLKEIEKKQGEEG